MATGLPRELKGEGRGEEMRNRVAVLLMMAVTFAAACLHSLYPPEIRLTVGVDTAGGLLIVAVCPKGWVPAWEDRPMPALSVDTMEEWRARQAQMLEMKCERPGKVEDQSK
jgi:hypothetical protein